MTVRCRCGWDFNRVVMPGACCAADVLLRANKGSNRYRSHLAHIHRSFLFLFSIRMISQSILRFFLRSGVSRSFFRSLSVQKRFLAVTVAALNVRHNATSIKSQRSANISRQRSLSSGCVYLRVGSGSIVVIPIGMLECASETWAKPQRGREGRTKTTRSSAVME